MTSKELQKIVLDYVAFKHNGRSSFHYLKIRDKMLQFSDKVWCDLITRYVKDGNVDFPRLLQSIRTRRRLK